MADSYFLPRPDTPTGRVTDRDGNGFVVAQAPTTGPWAPGLQHGGPPNALAVAAAEEAVRDGVGRDDLTAVRLAADFVGPVPVAELDVRSQVVRAARSATLVAVTVAAGGRDCLQARVWFVRDADLVPPAPPLPPAGTVPDEGAAIDAEFPYGASIEWRFVSGAMRTPGPAAVWARPRIPLVPGHTMSGLSRAALIGDSGNGVSAELDWDEWAFLNVDLDIHLARPVEGEWLLLDAATRFGPRGSGLARSTLSDVHGPVGAGAQTLVLAPRARS